MHVLLTGATGLLGQYLLRDLSRAGQPVAVLIRGQEKKTACDRLDELLAHWEQVDGQLIARPYLLEGDISAPGLGLSSSDRAWASRHCQSILHNAASLTFFGQDRDHEPWRSNYHGTAQVLDFCRSAGIRQFHYMSTAYVCGDREGLVYESDLDAGQGFRNDYEQCKFEAEKMVRSANFLDQLTVNRPAVICGDSKTGYTSTYHGLYSYVQFIWLARQLGPLDDDGRLFYPVRFPMSGDETKNLVPVEWVSAVTTEIFRHAEHHGKTYHLSPSRPITIRELLSFLTGFFQIYGPTLAGPQPLDFADMNEYEKMYYGYVARYDSYMKREPLFDARNTLAACPRLPCPILDADCIHRLADFAVQDRFGKKRPAKKSRPEPILA